MDWLENFGPKLICRGPLKMMKVCHMAGSLSFKFNFVKEIFKDATKKTQFKIKDY